MAADPTGLGSQNTRLSGLGWLGMLRFALQGGGGLEGMYSGLRRLHDQFGDGVVQGGGPIRFEALSV